MATYPYVSERTHDTGVITAASTNAARSTAVSEAEGRLKLDVADKIFLLESNNHPLVTFLTQFGKTWDGTSYKGSGIMKKPTTSYKFEWLEDLYGGRYAKVSGTYSASGALTITVTGAGSSSAYIFTPGDVIMNERTSERMLVATVASTTTITIASDGRAFGSTAAAAGADGDELFIIGNVNEENGASRNLNMTRSEKEYNYTQIFREPIGTSGTEKEVGLYGGSDLTYLRAKHAIEHVKDIEMAFWMGERKSDTTGTQTKPRRATGGVYEYISSSGAYVQDQGGPLTAPDLNVFFREGFTYGKSRKMLFCGNVVLSAINEMCRGQLQTVVGEKTYGVQVREWLTPFGTVNIVHNPMFVGELAGYGFLMDMECLKYRYIQNRDGILRLNIQNNDIDGEVDEYLTECGLQFAEPARCALLKGVTD